MVSTPISRSPISIGTPIQTRCCSIGGVGQGEPALPDGGDIIVHNEGLLGANDFGAEAGQHPVAQIFLLQLLPVVEPDAHLEVGPVGVAGDQEEVLCIEDP